MSSPFDKREKAWVFYKENTKRFGEKYPKNQQSIY